MPHKSSNLEFHVGAENTTDAKIFTNFKEACAAAISEACSHGVTMHGDPYHSQIWRVTVALHAMNQVVGTFGVEGLGPPRGGDYAPPYEYLNTGDTYGTTLIYRRRTDTLTIGSWGDIAERHPSWE